ncbi:ROK family protein [Stakelama marina]|uniref:fructokinase n=1 Tax=Stakelama marina TaxID=2826939 RepID=A0A8T4IN82_9SPHN|nr:ROK family protein [Stakelama marina]MBR0553789.1 ROK family protein [Stakelama marina]
MQTETAPLVAGIELGGTKCIAILAHSPDSVVERVRIDTTTPDATLGAIDDVLRRWRSERPVSALGIASFGPLQLDPAADNFGSIVATPKPGWNDSDVFGRFAATMGVPAAIQTDVNAAAMAEARWGAAKGLSAHCYITVGTGVGVGAVIDGKPVQGAMHGEAGHMRTVRAEGDDFAGHCPYHRDCTEGLVSGPAIAARFGMPGDAIPDDDARWRFVVHDFAAMLHNLVVTLAPERISIGGGVMAGRQGLLPAIRAALVESLAHYGLADVYCRTIDERVGPPGLGDLAGPMGAIAMGLSALKNR